MTFERFKAHINGFIAKAGGGITVRFNHTDDGRHFANCSDGTVITGNSHSLKLTVRYGSGHQMMASFAEVSA